MRFASPQRPIGGEELTQEVDRGYGGPATNLIRAVQLVHGTNCTALANLQDAFAAEFEIDTTQDLYEIKATLPRLQTTFVYAREEV